MGIDIDFFFLNLGIKGVIEKWVGCFLVYLFLGGFFCLKRVKKKAFARYN